MTKGAGERRVHPASFRDPCGFMFKREGGLYRLVNPRYFPEFEHLEKSGLLKKLFESHQLISHDVQERSEESIVLKPRLIPFISYAPEWSFEALKEAALLHLRINLLAIDHGMILKDASSYNVQFIGSQPYFIDTLSFDFYREGTPWYAFGQFCRHFIAPLLLMKYHAWDFNKMLLEFMDGLPMDLTSRLLPWKTHFSPFIKSYIHMHAKSIAKNQGRDRGVREVSLSRKALVNSLNYAKLFLEELNCHQPSSEWGDYYSFTNYSVKSFEGKQGLISRWVEQIGAKKIWDVGGNDGHFSSHIGVEKDLVIISDMDAIAIDKSFKRNKREARDNIYSLLVDVMNPTPSIGFANRERDSFLHRIEDGKFDCSLVLALIHHLCISNNCSFSMLAELFAPLSQYIIIEFVPREDSWVKKLLENMRERKHLFEGYSRENFELAFAQSYILEKREAVGEGGRELYLMKSKKFHIL